MSGAAAALVTLVEIQGGAARQLGSQMAVRDDGCYVGFVSGGCTEAAVATMALEAIATGEDRQVTFGLGSPYFDIVLPCGGSITLAIHVLRSAQPLLAVLRALDARIPAGLRYSSGPGTLDYLPDAPATRWNQDTFEVVYRPRVRLMICGGSLECGATARLAQAADYEVLSIEAPDRHRTSSLIDEDSAVVLLFHDLDRELPALHAALAAKPFYLGALGSQRTHQRRIKTLTEYGYGPSDIARVKAPIGIFPKAHDAHSLALSVLADVASVRTRVLSGTTEPY